jgi:hypothetical protein
MKTVFTKEELNISMKNEKWRGLGKFVKVQRAKKDRYGYEMLILTSSGSEVKSYEYFENLEQWFNENNK